MKRAAMMPLRITINDVQQRLIAAVVKDDTGDRWRECRVIGTEAFSETHREAWRAICEAGDYEQAAVAGRLYFKHPTCGESYSEDRDRMLYIWLGARGIGFAREWVRLLPGSGAGEDSREMTWDSLLSFDPANDLCCLMGKRFLGRTGAAVIAAPSGVGKSVLGLQLGGCAALGKAFFGLLMAFPMRVLLIQAEDDLGDVSEAAQGFIKEYGLTAEETHQLKERLRIVRWNDAAGARFLDRLRRELKKWPADLVIINPLFSFCGCNVSDQEKMSAFLRNGLNPILIEANAACVVIHHTNKPKDDEKPNKGDEELRYIMSGSGEITNWTRAVITLQQLKGAGTGVCRMTFAKRGNRAGLVDEDGKMTTSVLIEHSPRGLCWLPSGYTVKKGEGGKFATRFDLPRARLWYDPALSWAENRAAIAADQGVSTKTVERNKHHLDTAA